MPSLSRWLQSRIQRTSFHAEHSSSLPSSEYAYWCAARDLDPRGFLTRSRSESQASLKHIAERNLSHSLGKPTDSSDPRVQGWTPLHEACYLAHAHAARSIALAHPEWINARDSRGISPLRALFLFNDTAPGWKHPGPYSGQTKPLRLPTDEAMAVCLHIMVSFGAKLRGAELCSAAYMGLESTCNALAKLPYAHADRPDDFFPDWATRRGWILVTPRGCSVALSCALDGNHPACALPIALSAPRALDSLHATIFCKAGRFGDALSFLKARPSCAQAILEAICDLADPPEDPTEQKNETMLTRLAVELGADPRARRTFIDTRSLSSPLHMATIHARSELIAICLESIAPDLSEQELGLLAQRCSLNPGIHAQRRHSSRSLIERLILAKQCAFDSQAELVEADKRRSPKRL
jgi:hypothetical protein